jgi:putative transposase
MPNYKRAYYGRTYFFTVVTYSRTPLFRDETCIDLLRSVICDVRAVRPFYIDAMVVLPEHLHCIWTLTDGDGDYSKRWGIIKSEFTKRLRDGHGGDSAQNVSRVKRHEGMNWQRRFWEHQIRDDHDYQAHCDYIHYNPVKHGLVNAPKAWRHSSFFRFVQSGFYDEDWGNATHIEFEQHIGNE